MKTLSSTELRIALFKFPRAYSLLVDADYACPTTSWFSVFYDWWKKTRFDVGLTKWERINDCDNFARSFAQAAQDCYALTALPPGETRPEALAVGEFMYTQQNGGGHAIVIAFTEVGFVFIEPQTGQFLTLTEQEKDSCFYVRF